MRAINAANTEVFVANALHHATHSEALFDRQRLVIT
jgi:hypothetical protein